MLPIREENPSEAYAAGDSRTRNSRTALYAASSLEVSDVHDRQETGDEVSAEIYSTHDPLADKPMMKLSNKYTSVPEQDFLSIKELYLKKDQEDDGLLKNPSQHSSKP